MDLQFIQANTRMEYSEQGGESMRAIVYAKYGSPEVLHLEFQKSTAYERELCECAYVTKASR